MIINHNLPGSNAIRQMGTNQTSAAKSMEKLSSGLRINKAGDDAAGLAISEKMRGQIRGLDQASSNAQDGISMIQTAEGALSETHSILQRMRELAVQSANDTNVAVDRGEIQKEMDQLAKEVTRISNNTEFNTQKLINGAITDKGVGSANFQVGANTNQGINLSINAMDAKSLGITRDVSTASIDTDKNAAKLATVSSDSVDVTKTLADGKYTVQLTAQDAGATSATDATGTAISGLVTGTATADTNITLTYTDHGTAATNTAAAALVSGVAMDTATSLKVNGTTVTLNAVKALGSGYNALTNKDAVVTALQTDLNAALGKDNYKVSVGADNRLTITSAATGAGTKVDLTGSDAASATLLGFTGSVTGTNGAATGGVKDWVATGSLGGVVSTKNNTVNGITIDSTQLSTTAALGDTITVKGFKDATLSAQLQSVGTGVASTTQSTGVTVATGAVTGAATANTSVTLTYNASGAAATAASQQVGATAGNNLSFTVATSGAEFNGINVVIASGTVAGGSAAFVSGTNTLTITLSSTQADNTVSGINALISGVGSITTTAGTTIDFTQLDAAGSGQFAAGASGVTAAPTTAVTFALAGGKTANTWDATGDKTGTLSGTATTSVNGLTIDMSKITGATTTGQKVTISANVSADIGNKVTLDQKNGGSYVIGDANGAGQMKIGIKAGTATAGTSTVNLTTDVAKAATKQADGSMSNATTTAGLDVSTHAKASAAITTLQTAIESVSAERSKMGAYQNRLEHTIANLGTSSENLTSAESRIRDVNMAKEMSQFSKNNILSQAAQAMLAQANQQPQQVLQLLR